MSAGNQADLDGNGKLLELRLHEEEEKENQERGSYHIESAHA